MFNLLLTCCRYSGLESVCRLCATVRNCPDAADMWCAVERGAALLVSVVMHDSTTLITLARDTTLINSIVTALAQSKLTFPSLCKTGSSFFISSNALIGC